MGKYQAYLDYKDSGVEWLGDIPISWIALPIKMVSKIFNGATPKSGVAPFWDGDIPWVTPADLGKSVSPYISKGSRSITAAGYNSCGVSLVPKNSIILASRAPIGTLGIASNDLCTNQGCKSLVVKDRFVPEFLYYVLLSSTEQLNLLGRGSTFLELSADDLGSYKIPSPSECEQQKIASFLDHETAKIDTLIDKQQQLIRLLKEKRQAVISHAVTKGLNPNAPMRDSGVEWLGEVPEHWKVAKVKNTATIISKGTTPTTMGADFANKGVRFLKAENIGKSMFVQEKPSFYISESVDEQISRSQLQDQDVLVIIAGATTGLVSVLQKDLLPANTNQAVSFIRLKEKRRSKFSAWWLSTEFAQRVIWMDAVQAAQPNLSMEDLGNIPIVVPPIDEVTDLVEYLAKQLAKIDELHYKAETAIELMQERRTALISAAVTGKIDVRHPVCHPTGDLQSSKSTVHGDL